MAESTTALVFYAVAKNAGATIALSLPVAFVAGVLPNISIDTVFWCAAGGAMRWIAIRAPLGDGLAGICVGILMGLGLDGSNVPFLNDILPSVGTVGHARPFLTAAFAGTIFGTIMDLVNFKRKGSTT